MTLGEDHIVRIYAYYSDASIIERIVAQFRKLLIDIDVIYGYRCNDEGLYVFHLIVRDHPNFNTALLNLSKTVGIERVEVLESAIPTPQRYDDKASSSDVCIKEASYKSFTAYIHKYSAVKAYSWGDIHGENI